MRVKFDKNVTKKYSRFVDDFLWIFDRFWRAPALQKYANCMGHPSKIKKIACLETCSKNVTKMEQNASKTVPDSKKKPTKKRVQKYDRFLMDFGSIWPPKRRPKSWLGAPFWGAFSALGGHLAPKWGFRPVRTHFRSDFDDSGCFFQKLCVFLKKVYVVWCIPVGWSFDRALALHVRSLCHFSVPACR